MANFSKVQYLDDAGKKYPIRLSDKVVTAQTTAPSTATTYDVNISANVGRSARENGLRPRALLLSRTAGTAPNLKVYHDRMVVCNKADVAGYLSGGTVTIGGVVWTVQKVSNEDFK